MALPEKLTTFKNLLPEITIDGKKQVDFWNAWKISSEYVNSSRLVDEYVVEEGVTWYKLAEVIYDNRELWWVIPMFNEIENPFLIFTDSTLKLKRRKLKVLKPRLLNEFLNEIRAYRLLQDRFAE